MTPQTPSPRAAAPAAGTADAATGCQPEAGDAAGSAAPASLLTFGDLLKLAPVTASRTPDEAEEKLPETSDLAVLLPLMNVPVGAPMGVTLAPPVPACAPGSPAAASKTPAVALSVTATTTGATTATPTSAQSPAATLLEAIAVAQGKAGDEGSTTASKTLSVADLATLLPELAPDPAKTVEGASAPLVHLRTLAELSAAVPVSTDDAGAALAASGLAAGPAPAAQDTSAAQAAPPPVTVPPSHPDWSREIAASVAWSVRHKSTDVEIKLHPPELGALRVLLKIDGHKVEAQFTAPVAETRAALEQTLPRLREALAAQGLSLMHANVSDQQRQTAAESGFAPVNFADGEEEALPAPVVVRIKVPGLVDEYA